jgi:hypothetical protein
MLFNCEIVASENEGQPAAMASICDVSSQCGQLIALSLKSDHGSDHIVRISADIVDRTVHVKNGFGGKIHTQVNVRTKLIGNVPP